MPPEVTTPRSLSGTELFKEASKSVYAIKQPASTPRDEDTGSAVAVSPNVAVTNCHLVPKGKKVYVAKPNVEGKYPADLIHADYGSDRCFLWVKGLWLTPVRGVRSFDKVQIGEKVYAIGNPITLDTLPLSLSDGLVAGKRKSSGIKQIQFTAPISTGNSGGGLFDEGGNLVGITTASHVNNFAQNVNFAIAIEEFWREWWSAVP